MPRSRIAAILLTALAAGTVSTGAQAGGDTVPVYEVPAGIGGAAPETARRAEAFVARILAGRSPPETAGAARCLTGLGPEVLPVLVATLRTAPWRARAAIVGAVAEMDAPIVSPLLAAAARDPAFAVREAAVRGLGKTGDAAGAAVLPEFASAEAEPSWRVRSETAAALRRATLRGVLPRDVAGAALVRLLADTDPDVARAALAAAAPLALDEALPAVLAVFADTQRPSADREQALAALRAYRKPAPELLAALRLGFLQGTQAVESVRAGRALFDVVGTAILGDEEIGATIVRQLADEAAPETREALVSLGREAVPWLAREVRDARRKKALSSTSPGESAFEPLVAALLQIDEPSGIEVLRETLAGPGADAYHADTRLEALSKVELSYAARFRDELRQLFASREARDIRGRVLRAIASSGGDDVPSFVEQALRDEQTPVRSAAIEVLDSNPKLPTPALVAELAAKSPLPRERSRALQCLARRDAKAAAAVAVPLLSHPDPDLRQAAIAVLAATRDPAHTAVLLRRLDEEDGRSSIAAPTSDRPPPPSATTGSDFADTETSYRRRLRAALVGALGEVGGDAAKPALLRLAFEDAEPRVRESALIELRRRIVPEDAPRLAARLKEETSDSAHLELRRLLAMLAEAPEAQAVFEAEMASDATRVLALRLLSEARSRVVPGGLEAGLENPAWTDDERLAALSILVRAGKPPSPEALGKLARSARIPGLLADACTALAADPTQSAHDELARLIGAERDASRRAQIIRAAGERRSEAFAPALVAILDEARPAALAAAATTDPAVELYRETALALGRIGTPNADRALVNHLLDPSLAALGAAHSVHRDGPFQPVKGAVVSSLRALVCAVAHAGERELAAMFGDALARRAAAGERFLLDEEYVDGLARYLGDPAAFDLPPRRRPAAALLLWTLVAEGPPRMSPLDAEAWERAADELTSQGRFGEAVTARDRAAAVSDIEEASRPREDRQDEQARRAALTARIAAAAGRRDDAVRIASAIRAADPASANLADIQGWCLVQIGGPAADALAALRDAVALDPRRNARDLFHLAYATEIAEGPGPSLPFYATARAADLRRVSELGQTEYQKSRNGRQHPWGHFRYYEARALAASGDTERAATALHEAILMDDRYGPQALADAAFAKLPHREDVVDEALGTITDDPVK